MVELLLFELFTFSLTVYNSGSDPSPERRSFCFSTSIESSRLKAAIPFVGSSPGVGLFEKRVALPLPLGKARGVLSIVICWWDFSCSSSFIGYSWPPKRISFLLVFGFYFLVAVVDCFFVGAGIEAFFYSAFVVSNGRVVAANAEAFWFAPLSFLILPDSFFSLVCEVY